MIICRSIQASARRQRKWRPSLEVLESRWAPAVGLEHSLPPEVLDAPPDVVVNIVGEQTAEPPVETSGEPEVVAKEPEATVIHHTDSGPRRENVLADLVLSRAQVAMPSANLWWLEAHVPDNEPTNDPDAQRVEDALLGSPGAGYFQSPDGETFDVIVTVRSVPPAAVQPPTTDEPPLLTPADEGNPRGDEGANPTPDAGSVMEEMESPSEDATAKAVEPTPTELLEVPVMQPHQAGSGNLYSALAVVAPLFSYGFGEKNRKGLLRNVRVDEFDVDRPGA